MGKRGQHLLPWPTPTSKNLSPTLRTVAESIPQDPFLWAFNNMIRLHPSDLSIKNFRVVCDTSRTYTVDALEVLHDEVCRG